MLVRQTYTSCVYNDGILFNLRDKTESRFVKLYLNMVYFAEEGKWFVISTIE